MDDEGFGVEFQKGIIVLIAPDRGKNPGPGGKKNRKTNPD